MVNCSKVTSCVVGESLYDVSRQRRGGLINLRRRVDLISNPICSIEKTTGSARRWSGVVRVVEINRFLVSWEKTA